MSIDFAVWLVAHDGDAYSALKIASEEADEDFESWFRSNGGYLHPCIELTSSSSEGNFLRVKEGRSLSPGSTFVSCPHDLSLSWASANRYHFPSIRSSFVPHVSTRLFVMKQYLLKAHSPWWPYIRSLPQPYDSEPFRTPMYYNSEDLLWIQGTNLEHARQVRKDAWQKEYDDAFDMLFRYRDGDEQKEFWTWFVTSNASALVMESDLSLMKGIIPMGLYGHQLSKLSRSCGLQSRRTQLPYTRQY